eukprot:TRINITY_DN993_c0_g1_i2.p1 TRINITY_DN993_c0_g1~~TRINITY_DN993_c0_g1_i2.p1  ORF type:complete len:308 (-),score=49.66 TRINITY_DN993_c0_g1_i2:12-836(-)
MEALKDLEEVTIDTPFGPPSDKFMMGTIDGIRVVFVPRHGRAHHLTPSEVPYKANIYALKKLGVKYILSASAVGSLKAECKPLDVVLPSQFIDRTKKRDDTFFGNGIVAHVSLGDPVCHSLKGLVAEAVRSLKLDAVDLHDEGTYLNMEGPAFSTKAESNMYRQWGATIIGMTNFTEAKLAREAEMAYASICMVTDYDCWHPDHDNVTVDMVIKNLHKNAQTVQSIICETIKRVHQTMPDSEAFNALKFAIMTQLPTAPKMTLQKLDAILQKSL